MKYYDCLGHELHIGDNVQFRTTGFTVIGTIIGISGNEQTLYQMDLFGGETKVEPKKSKYIISPIGWRGTAEMRSKLKKQYKVNVDNKTLCLVTVKYKS